MTAPTEPRLPGGGTPHPQPPRIGGLFEGFGGLTMAVRAVLGGRLSWYSEIDPGACALLEHREPDVPNLGDIATVPWHLIAVDQRVDVLAGGFPCQDVSLAGLMAGLMDGTRSGLWIEFARAIDELRPALVVIENVRGLCSAPAACDLEPCPWCVGDDEGVPLRALGAVLGDLAIRGYDTQWCGLRAADVGAPHGRFRIFILAWRRDLAAHTAGDGHGHTGSAGVGGVPAAAVAGGERGAVADAHGDAVREQPVGQSGSRGAAVAGLAGAERPAAHADGLGHERDRPARDGWTGSAHDGQPPTYAEGDGPQAVRLAQRAGADEPVTGGGLGLAADADGERQQQRTRDVADLARRADHRAALTVNWGIYEPGIRGWEHALGRSAPAPRTWSTSYRRALQARLDGRNRKPVGMRGSLEPQYSLNPVFVEWLMGLPAGWVTDVPGLTSNQMLRLLGNGVVPQQGIAALAYLLDQAPAFVRAWLATRTHLHAAAA